MKKSIGLLALALAFAACNKNEIEFQPENAAQGIPFSATVSAGKSLDTRALAESGTTLEATWAVGEKVALIHNGVSDEMTVSSVSEGLATITGTITGSPSDGDDVTIIYPSSAADGTTGNVKSDLLYRQDGTLTGTEGTSIAEKYDVRKGASTLKVSGTASLNGNVSLDNQIAIFKFTVRAADGTTAISAKLLVVIIGSDTYRIVPKTATDVLYAALPAVSAREVRFVATEVSGKTYSCAKASATFSARKYYQSTLKMNLTTETMNGHDYVDMGLVLIDGVEKNLYWATSNVGAENPWEYGDYYAWGETEPKSNYATDWSNYFDTNDGGKTFTKYNTSGGKTVLDLEDDAANMNWSGTWRIPTEAEWTVLCDETRYTWEWTYDYLGDGSNHSGMIVTCKAGNGACSGNSIFLPAAGGRGGADLYYDGFYGDYWSSSLDEYYSGWAWDMCFISEGEGMTGHSRFYGSSVRPVTSAPVNENTEHEYVDMGYGMKWATMNIGANSPEEGGDFFAWGETAPKSTYSLSTYFDQSYQTYRWQSGPTLGRPIRLKREDDAAHVLWGDDWRMPNYEECVMLSDKTKFTWTWNNAKQGYKVTSKQTGNSIFLPAAGRKEASTTNLAGVLGGFWASSSRAYGESQVVYASALNYSSVNTADPAALQNMVRTCGYPIRPIRVNKVNGHEYIDMGNGLGWAVENLGTDAEHPSGGLYSFDNGDPATREWGAPWRTALWTEWKQLVNEENSYKENSATFEQKGWWMVNREALLNSSLLPDRCIFLPATHEDGQAGGYWTGTKRQADGKRWMVYINDDLTATDYTALDEWYRAVRPVFTLPAPEDNQGGFKPNEGMNDGIKFQHLDQYTTPSDPDPFDF